MDGPGEARPLPCPALRVLRFDAETTRFSILLGLGRTEYRTTVAPNRGRDARTPSTLRFRLERVPVQISLI